MEKQTFGRLAVVMVILAIALASVTVGYAYIAYTENSDNTADVEYLTITPTTDGSEKKFSGSFTEKIELDTVTSASGITYSLADGTFQTIGGHEYASLGKIYLTVDERASTVDYNVSTAVLGGTGLNTTDYSYYAFYQIGSGSSVSDAKTAAESSEGSLVTLVSLDGNMVATSGTIDNATENNYTVVLTTIYVGMNGGDSKLVPFDSTIDNKVLDAVSFQFSAKIVA